MYQRPPILDRAAVRIHIRNNCVFIGGSYDGKSFAIPHDKDIWQLNEKKYIPVDYPIRQTDTYRAETYVREMIIVDNTVIHFFRLQELSLTEAIIKLFAGYKP